jgi:SpoVK/Ycf46/Vps4 family AAA+-type ATPase
MTHQPFILAGLLLTLGACALPPEYPAIPGLAEPGTSVMLGELARVDALTPAQRRRELADLENVRRPDAARRFQQAALLAREEGTEPLERSLQILNSLPAPDVRTQTLIDLMKKSLKTRIELVQQTARTQELQDKLEQIKALEKSLQQRNGSATP